jgi:hypothetical protein
MTGLKMPASRWMVVTQVEPGAISSGQQQRREWQIRIGNKPMKMLAEGHGELPPLHVAGSKLMEHRPISRQKTQRR